jgi:hypothetical protein
MHERKEESARSLCVRGHSRCDFHRLADGRTDGPLASESPFALEAAEAKARKGRIQRVYFYFYLKSKYVLESVSVFTIILDRVSPI